MKLQKVRGTIDLYGNNIKLFNYIIDSIKILAYQHCFEEISTPIIENSSVFYRTLGETSDILKKETYTFIDRDKTEVTLRPEFTAAIIRAIISNKMLQSLPLRLFSYGPLFRHERPQKCRFRQFNQINFEYIGCPSINADVELIILANSILNKLQVNRCTRLKVNTLGDKTCRDKYKIALCEYLYKYKNDLSCVSQQRLSQNPLRILDTKNIKEQDILKDGPMLINFINTDGRNRFEKILSRIQSLNINYDISTSLVRGIDYYSDFVFEFVTKKLGSQGTVIAGGRYDNLILEMSGTATPSTGFAAGVERVMSLIDAPNNQENSAQIYLIPIGKNAECYSHKIAQDIRKLNINVLIDYELTLRKKMKKANRLNIKYCILFGENELSEKTFIIKDMSTSKEIKVQKDSLINFLSDKYT